MSDDISGSAFLPLNLPINEEEFIALITCENEESAASAADKINRNLHFERFQLDIRAH